MDCFVLTDAQWAKMAPHSLGKLGDPGRSGRNNRLFVEAVLWIARTGSPWRDLPPAFGHWSGVYTRFRDWVRADVWRRLFEAASDDPDMEYAMIDATIVKVQRHGHGGMTTKVLALADALGNLARFALLPGQCFDTVGVAPLIDGVEFDALIADKAFDSDAIIAALNERGAKIVISHLPTSTPLKAARHRPRDLQVINSLIRIPTETLVRVGHGACRSDWQEQTEFWQPLTSSLLSSVIPRATEGKANSRGAGQ
jgi:transposase